MIMLLKFSILQQVHPWGLLQQKKLGNKLKTQATFFVMELCIFSLMYNAGFYGPFLFEGLFIPI